MSGRIMPPPGKWGRTRKRKKGLTFLKRRAIFKLNSQQTTGKKATEGGCASDEDKY